MLNHGPIVIVDDDPDDLALIKEICRMLRIPNELVLCNGADQILEYLSKTREQPFLILSDINMPVINGLQLRKMLNDDDSLKSKAIPFIFLSTTAVQAQVDIAYEMTVQGFFEKGHDFQKLKYKLQLIFEYWKECKHPYYVKLYQH